MTPAHGVPQTVRSRSGPRFTLRWKITLGILFSFILLLPVIVLTLYYLREILDLELRITEVLAVRQADARAMHRRLDAIRRAEVRYLITRDGAARIELDEHFSNLKGTATRVLGDEDPKLEPLRAVMISLEHYQGSLEALLRIVAIETGEDPFRDLEIKIRRFQGELDRLLEQANLEPDPASRQEHFRRAQDFLASFEEFFVDLETAKSPDKADLVHRLQAARREVRRITEEFEQMTNAEIETSRIRIAALSNQARKYILSMLILTGLLGLAWILIVPRRISLSIHRITNILRQAQLGSLDLPAAPEGNGEIGELGRHLNRFVSEARAFDRLKTDRIQEERNRFEVLAASIDDPVLIVDDTDRILFANDPLLQALGVDRDGGEAMKTLSDSPGLQKVVQHVRRGEKDPGAQPVPLTIAGGAGREFLPASSNIRVPEGRPKQVLIVLKPVSTASSS